MTKIPNYLVQVESGGTLYSYWTLEILLIGLVENRDNPPKAIYRLMPGLVSKYEPVTEAQLRAELKGSAA